MHKRKALNCWFKEGPFFIQILSSRSVCLENSGTHKAFLNTNFTTANFSFISCSDHWLYIFSFFIDQA